MLSDDVYKARRRTTIAAIETWVAGLTSVAAVDVAADAAAWRVSVTPRVPEACAFELVLRDDQRYDLSIGAEIHEDLPVESLDLFLPLLQAVAAGNVMTRRFFTAATNMLVKVETIVSGQGGDAAWPWRMTRSLPSLTAAAGDELIRHDRMYVPYARGA